MEWLSGALVQGVEPSSGDGEVQLLNVIIDPFVDHIIQVSQDTRNKIDEQMFNFSLVNYRPC